MSTGDIFPYDNANSAKMGGALKFKVTANSTGADGTVSRIRPGEPVTKVAGAAGVLAAATNAPTTTLRIVGVAASTSNETASVDGTVDVIPAMPGQQWLIAPKVAATWNTQAKYNALVGSRVLIDNTTGTYTILATDGASNGCVVEFLDISKYPGLVAFSFNAIVNYANV
jgi:hypothetical protein